MLVNRRSGQWDYEADEKTVRIEQARGWPFADSKRAMLRASLISTTMGDERGRSATCPSYLLRMWLTGSKGGEAVWPCVARPLTGERLTSRDVKAPVASLVEKNQRSARCL